MSQIQLKFEFHAFGMVQTWWNLASRLQPRDLRFANEDSWIDLKIGFEII
jgi:hypothetical protein